MVKILKLIFLTICTTVSSAPGKSLESPQEKFDWNTWYFFDQNSNEIDLEIIRKRITSKSVFIAPSFNMNKLPECADGYRSDALGRCVKVLKLNQEAHLNFLLQRLIEQFSQKDNDVYSKTDDELEDNVTELPCHQKNDKKRKIETQEQVTHQSNHQNIDIKLEAIAGEVAKQSHHKDSDEQTEVQSNRETGVKSKQKMIMELEHKNSEIELKSDEEDKKKIVEKRIDKSNSLRSGPFQFNIPLIDDNLLT